jgi:ATP synthase protein I
VAHDPNDAPQQPVAEDPALDSLEARLAAARKAEGERLAKDHAPYPSAGFTVVSIMLGYPLGGIVVGFAIDNIVGTTPWVTIGLMFTAFIGAFVQVMRLNKTRNS